MHKFIICIVKLELQLVFASHNIMANVFIAIL